MGEVVRVTVGKEQQVRRGEGRMDLYGLPEFRCDGGKAGDFLVVKGVYP